MKLVLRNSRLSFEMADYTPNQFTLKAIEASGNTTMSANQKKALEKFFNDIGATDNSGIFSKLDFLYIPMLANKLRYTLVNYKDNSRIVEPSSDTYKLINKGISSYGMEGSQSIMLAETYDMDMTDVSMFVAISTPFEQLEDNTISFFTKTSPTQFRTAQLGFGTNYYIKVYDTSARNLTTNRRLLNGYTDVLGFSLNGNTAYIYGEDDMETNFVSDLTPVSPLYLMSNYAGTVLRNKNPMCFAALGKKLTKNETELFGLAIEELRSAFTTISSK